MSACFIQSFKTNEVKNKLKPYKDALTCVSCHNPHVIVKVTGNDVFNAVCINCHEKPNAKKCTEAGVAKYMAKNSDLPHEKNANCVNCHMPPSGAIDIPHVSVHDHYIRKPMGHKEKEQLKKFLGLFAINEKKPDSLTIAKAYMAQYEKFEQKALYLDSAARYLSTQNRKDIRKNFKVLIQLYFLKNDFAEVHNLVHLFGSDSIFKNLLNKKSYDNENAWTAYRIGESYTYLGNQQEAIRYFEQATKLAPFIPDFINKLATAYASGGNNQTAHTYFTEALKENPRYIPAINNLGYLYVTEGNSNRAEQLYQQALKLDHDNENTLLNLAGLYNYQGKFAESKKILLSIQKKHPENKQVDAILKTLPK